MKRKGKSKGRVLVRTTNVAYVQKSLTNNRNDQTEAPMVVCRDCKSPSPVAALIPVDALHVQCPLCLYVFFTELQERRMKSG